MPSDRRRCLDKGLVRLYHSFPDADVGIRIVKGEECLKDRDLPEMALFCFSSGAAGAKWLLRRQPNAAGVGQERLGGVLEVAIQDLAGRPGDRAAVAARHRGLAIRLAPFCCTAGSWFLMARLGETLPVRAHRNGPRLKGELHPKEGIVQSRKGSFLAVGATAKTSLAPCGIEGSLGYLA